MRLVGECGRAGLDKSLNDYVYGVRSSIIILQMLNVLYFIVDYVIIKDLTPYTF